MPSWVGRTLPSFRIPGVLRYSWTSPAANPVKAAPTKAEGTNGISNAAPSAISPVERIRANCSGARPCRARLRRLRLPDSAYSNQSSGCTRRLRRAAVGEPVSFSTPLDRHRHVGDHLADLRQNRGIDLVAAWMRQFYHFGTLLTQLAYQSPGLTGFDQGIVITIGDDHQDS